MTSRESKLEQTWIGKDKRPKLEPRLLLEQRIFETPLITLRWSIS